LHLDFQGYASLTEFQKEFSSEQICSDFLQAVRWPVSVESPFSPFGKVYVCTNARFRCRDTGRYFNAKTGTIFHGSKIPLQKWFCAMFLLYLTPTLSSRNLSNTLNLPLKSSRKVLRVLKEVQPHIPQRPNQSLADWLQNFRT